MNDVLQLRGLLGTVSERTARAVGSLDTALMEPSIGSKFNSIRVLDLESLMNRSGIDLMWMFV